jgi:transcription elongation factor Elf1
MNVIFDCPHCRREVVGVFPTFVESTLEGMRYDVTCEICLHQTLVIIEPKEYIYSQQIHDAGLDEVFLN